MQETVTSRTPIDEGLTPMGLSKALGALQIKCRYNTFTHRHEWSQNGGEWESWDDRSSSFQRHTIQIMFEVPSGKETRPMFFSKEKFWDCLDAIGELYEYDSLNNWILELPEWDGEVRLPNLLTRMFGAEGSEINQWVSKLLLCGPIDRALNAGRRNRVVPVLMGQHGIGKSEFVLQISPNRNWVLEGLAHFSHKETIENTQGRWIIELPELAGATKAEISKFKAFVTATSDTARKAYGRSAETVDRRFFMIGTANRSSQIPSESASSARFIIVELYKGCDVKKFLDPVREQLWAEAYRLVMDGFDTVQVPRQLQQEHERSNDPYLSGADEIFNRIEQIEQFEGVKSSEDLARECGILYADQSVFSTVPQRNEFCHLLQRAGYERKQIRITGTGQRRKGYRYPDLQQKFSEP